MKLLQVARCHLAYIIPALVLIHQGAEGTEYGAAVVEYHYTSDPIYPQQTLLNNVKQYVQIIHQFKHKLTTQLHMERGIIVFPECGLIPQLNVSDVYVPVPEPSYQYPNLTGNKVLSALSEAAKDTGLYVVVNLLEASGQKRYNTDVVFRSNGTIAARYRKFNLYGEAMDRTPTAEVVSFATDFNVTFGMFICFDILYQHPALDLVKLGVRHFVFSSAWFSELPFLTAVQYQMSWSWMNDATLLASGLGNTTYGSTGTGIYLGKKGPLVYYQANNTRGSVLVSAVLDSSNPESGNSPSLTLLDQSETSNLQLKQSEKYTPEQGSYESAEEKEVIVRMRAVEEKRIVDTDKGLRLKHEPLSEYTTHLVAPEKDCLIHANSTGQLVNCTSRIKRRLCNRGLCCSFDVTTVFTLCRHPCRIVPQLISDDFSLSVHRMAVFNGVRSFDVTTGGTQTCGIVSCTNSSVSSCGHTPTIPISVLDNPHTLLYRYIKRVKIQGHFDLKDAFISPDILLGHSGGNDDLLPTFGVLTNNFTMDVNGTGHAVLEFENDSPYPLGTAAIFSRIFSRDGQQVSGAHRPVSLLLSLLLTTIFLNRF